MRKLLAKESDMACNQDQQPGDKSSIYCTTLQDLSQRLQQDESESNRLSTLIDISFELISPYFDLRPEYRGDIRLSEIFWLLCGEGEATLKAGRRLQATITGISGEAAYCTLPDINDMEAVILADDISSSGHVRPADRLRRGDTVPARYADCAHVQLKCIVLDLSSK